MSFLGKTPRQKPHLKYGKPHKYAPYSFWHVLIPQYGKVSHIIRTERFAGKLNKEIHHGRKETGNRNQG